MEEISKELWISDSISKKDIDKMWLAKTTNDLAANIVVINIEY